MKVAGAFRLERRPLPPFPGFIAALGPGIVWMALARMVKTRLGLGGEVSEQRALALSQRLIEQVKRWAARRPLLVCTDGLGAYLRAMRETLREPVYTGQGGRPRAPW